MKETVEFGVTAYNYLPSTLFSSMEEAPIPFGDEVGLEVLRSLRELGEGLSRLSEQDIGDRE